MKYRKVYVEVVATFKTDGRLMPLLIVWENGKKYKVDKVKFITPCASTKVGGRGMRYTVLMNGKERNIFNEEGKWFVEAEDYRESS